MTKRSGHSSRRPISHIGQLKPDPAMAKRNASATPAKNGRGQAPKRDKRQPNKPQAQLEPGRPTSLTPEVQTQIVNMIRAGNYNVVAAEFVGIAEATFYNWLKRGREGEPLYLEFLEAIKKAESESEAFRVEKIITASRQQWQAAAWWLERKMPEKWARKDYMIIKRDLKSELIKIAQDDGYTYDIIMGNDNLKNIYTTCFSTDELFSLFHRQVIVSEEANV